MTPPDDQLVRATLAGDMRAFERIVERHRELVLRVAARIVGEDDAEDVAQDAFLRAYHRLARSRGDAPVRGWLLQIVHKRAGGALNRRRVVSIPLDESLHEMPDAAERTPAARLESAERLRRLDVKL